MSGHVTNLSLTPTVGKQTQHRNFGELLKDSLKAGGSALGTVSGIIGNAPGLGIVSAAVSAVTSLGGQGQVSSVQRASSGVVSIGSEAPGSSTGIEVATPPGMGGMVSQMRAEADRSIALQMQMQQESRDYNTLTNVLKTRHDSAKSAINNIR